MKNLLTIFAFLLLVTTLVPVQSYAQESDSETGVVIEEADDISVDSSTLEDESSATVSDEEDDV